MTEKRAPIVTVIISHHLDRNRPYLDACLQALDKSVGVGAVFETLVISSADSDPVVPRGMTAVHNRMLDTATKKAHFGIAMSDPRSKYFLFLSDDVVVGPNMLARLIEGVGDSLMICNPMSNSDNGGQFLTKLPWACEVDLEDTPNPPATVALAESTYGARTSLLVHRPYVCFYCTLIPRVVWDQVGALDERLENRHNDQDYCMRAAKLGIPSMINFGAFAIHYGSKTLKHVAPESLRNEATRVFFEKWGAQAQ